MAIDRLSRHFQQHQGVVNEDQMMQFLPVFPLGDKNKDKQMLYL